MSDLLNDWTSTKTYATRENLDKALVKYGVDDVSVLKVRTPEGRWTAIFPFGVCRRMGVYNVAQLGFKVVG